MSPQFIAAPPPRLRVGSDLKRHLWRMIRSIGVIVCQAFIPFEPRPKEIDPLPDPAAKLTDVQVRLCQWLFDQAEARRTHLEQKAQSTFGLMVFLVPLLSSVLVFLINKPNVQSAWNRIPAIAFACFSAILVLLGFISVLRALSVKAYETLFLGTVIDTQTGKFRDYIEADHARGLLYCTSMNTAVNDHIAQFVKGGQILMAAGVMVLLAAVVPASLMVALPAPSTETKIVGSINVSFVELKELRDEVANIRKELSTQARNTPPVKGRTFSGARMTSVKGNRLQPGGGTSVGRGKE